MCVRDSTVPNPLQEPYGSLLAFLDDLDQQASTWAGDDELSRQVIERLRAQLAALALVVVAAGGGSVSQ